MTWRLFGRETRNPLAIGLVLVLCLALLPATLVPHLFARLIGGDGFMHGNMYEPGPFWTAASNIVAYGLLIVLVIV